MRQKEERERKAQLELFRHRQTKMADGQKKEVFCNIGTPEEAAAALEKGGEGIGLFRTEFLFTEKSGTGKSTHTRLWREYLGEKAVMVNDDKPMLKITDNGVIAYGTPYNGKHHLGCNMSVPLKAICILTRGEKNSIVRIDKKEAYAMILQQVYRPHDPLQMAKTLKLADRLAVNTELYRLACNMDIEAAEVAYNAMKG